MASSDPLEDPLVRLEINERQAKQALVFVVASAVAVVLLGLSLAAFFGGSATGCTPSGDSAALTSASAASAGAPAGGNICLSADRVLVVALPTLLSIGLAVTSGLTTYRRWQRHIRWRPWLFASYAMWMLTSGYLLVSASAVFVQVG